MHISGIQNYLRFNDDKGFIRAIFCGLTLFMFLGFMRAIFCGLALCFSYGLRDYIVAAIGEFTCLEPTLGNTTQDQRAFTMHNTTSMSNTQNRNLMSREITDVETFYYLDTEHGWNRLTIGMVLGIAHFGSCISMALAPIIVQRASMKIIICVCLFSTGFISFFSRIASDAGGWNFIIVRLFIGLVQGNIPVCVYIILQGLQLPNFAIIYSIIFLGPWVGSSFGMLLGASSDPFITTYIMGSILILLAGFSLTLPLEEKGHMADLKEWKEILSSKAALTCVSMQFAMVFAMHTFIVGLGTTLHFKFGYHTWGWVLLLIALTGGIISRGLGVVPLRIINTSLLSALNRRRMLISAGSIITITALTMCGTLGLKSDTGVVLCSLIGFAAGSGLGELGIHMSIHDLAPVIPIPLLHLVNLGGTIGAGIASLMFPVLTLRVEVGEEDTANWVVAWILPVIIVTIATAIYSILLSVNPLPHQVILYSIRDPVLNTISHGVDGKNGLEDIGTNGSLKISAALTDPDAKSFKSLQSAFSYITAISSRRRTSSFVSAAGDIDLELKSIAPSEHSVCKTIPVESIDDMHSANSDNGSFKSIEPTGNGIPISAVTINITDLDRTSAWLTAHHSPLSPGQKSQISKDKQRAQRNMLLALYW